MDDHNRTVSPDCIAFAAGTCIAKGPIIDVAVAVKELLMSDPSANVLVFDQTTSNPVELDLRGEVDDVIERLQKAGAPQPEPRGPGRPRLGVVSKEVTLLPRHWEWLAAQPGGASVTLRKLVEHARLEGGEEERARRARDVTYRFMLAVAGDQLGFEEATRSLYAGDATGFWDHTESWPEDIRDHARHLAMPSFSEAER